MKETKQIATGENWVGRGGYGTMIYPGTTKQLLAYSQ
jgi:hypothetical protein